MTQREKAKFRYSDEWKDFRSLCKKESGNVDYITREPLTQRGWELHHLDVTKDGYTQIGNKADFICVNHSTHLCLHYLYDIVSKLSDKEADIALTGIFDRYRTVLKEMRAKCHTD